MKPLSSILPFYRHLITGAVVILLFASEASAADSVGFTRSDWDMIMRWVNFIILAVLIIKYARKPLTDFLNKQRNEVATLIDRFEHQKKEAELKIQESQRQLAESEQRLKIVEERIIAEGERRKAAVIEAARSESRLMIESAQGKIEGQLREAYGILKAEVIDLASEKALSKIATVISDEDQHRLVHQWFEAARS